MIELEYLPPYQSFGRPLTPEILEAIGIVTECRPAGDEPANSGVFEFWTTTSRRGVFYEQGRLELTIGASRVAGRRSLQVRELRRGADQHEQREHWIEAEIECRTDEYWSPGAWSYASWMHDPANRILPETVLRESVIREGRTLRRQVAGGEERERLAGRGPLTSHWSLWEAVRHLPRKRGLALSFDCLEHLRKLKTGHCIRFVDTRKTTLAGRAIRLHRFLQTGCGILPTEYFVDDDERLLLVIDANRVAVARALRPRSADTADRPVARPRRSTASRSVPSRPARAKDAPPNILFVCTDQQHWQALSAAGNRHLTTPAMDALCQRGVRLETAYCTNPICSPSRSSLFTGRMPSETGVNRLNPPAFIRPEIPTIGQWLGDHGGYDSIFIGKWHVPGCHSYDIPGFRVLASGQDHRGDVSDVTVSHAAEAFLRQRRSCDPFLLVTSLMQPHDICDWLRLNQSHKRVPPYPLPRRALPALPPLPKNFSALPSEPEYVRRYRDEKCEPNVGGWDATEWCWYLWNYYRMVEMADAELGRILSALDASGQTENTVVVFTSDHGEGMGEHRLDRKNFHYEAAVRVPLVFSWPGRLPARKVNRRALVSGIDLVPTLCGFAGVEPPPLTTAVDLGPVLTGRDSEARPSLAVEMSVRAVGRVLRTPRYKYAVFAEDPVEQLFDLRSDPGETRNLAGQRAFEPVLQAHRDQLAAWEQRLDPVADAPGAGAFAPMAR